MWAEKQRYWKVVVICLDVLELAKQIIQLMKPLLQEYISYYMSWMIFDEKSAKQACSNKLQKVQ